MQSSSHVSSAEPPQRASRRSSVANWLDRQAPNGFVLPAVLLILGFSIFPLVTSAYLSLMRFSLGEGGYELKFVGLRNYVRLFSGSQQFHFVGVFRPAGFISIAVMGAAALATAWWLVGYLRGRHRSVVGSIGRLIAAVFLLALVWLSPPNGPPRGAPGR